MVNQLNRQMCSQLSEIKQFELLTTTIENYEAKESNLIQILHIAQVIFGYLPENVLKFIAKELSMPYSKVCGVVSFYSYFSTLPKGRHTIKICLGTACYVRGGTKLIEKIKELLSIDVGETTPDMKFSFEVMRCIGACGLAPAMAIDDKVYKRVNPNKLKQILDQYS
ncbi:MAG: NAD(P)H-dependent oxidoreductase subunit E [Clostridia bacterium]|nr:NAD(P)H-dependent oxidoreductase subunit E [Clostridia bacterium]